MNSRYFSIIKRTAAVAVFVFLISSCGVSNYIKQGDDAWAEGDWDKSVKLYIKALDREPDNVKLRIALGKAVIAASNYHMKKGEEFFANDEFNIAIIEFDKSLEYYSGNSRAAKGKQLVLKEIERRKALYKEQTSIESAKKNAEQNSLKPEDEIDFKKKPYTLQFNRTELSQIFRVLSKLSGVDFVFDAGFKSKRVKVDMVDVTFMDALNKLLIQSDLFYKIIDEKTLLIAPDIPAKRKKYEELVMKTFFLSNAEPKEIVKAIQKHTGLTKSTIDANLNAITVKGTPGRVDLAEKLVKTLDKALGEVIINLEIIEVNKKKIKEYGIELSSYTLTQTYSPTGLVPEKGPVIRMNQIGKTDLSDYILNIPSVNYKLLQEDSLSKVKAKPQVRSVDRQEVQLKLGDRVPIPTTSFVPQYSSGVNQQPITSFSHEDIGITVKLTPTIHHEGWVTLKLEFELSFITSPGSATIPPTIGSRKVTSTIRLRDNETTIMAGLLRETERNSMKGFPLVSSIPVLKSIFSGNKDEVEQTDIVITITPRILRYTEINEEDLAGYWAGTESRPGLKSKPPVMELKRKRVQKRDKQSTSEKKKQAGGSVAEKITDKDAPKEEEPDESNQKEKGDSIAVKAELLCDNPEVKAGEFTDSKLSVSCGSDVRLMRLNYKFDPSVVEIQNVKASETISEKGLKIFRTWDNDKGLLSVNVRFSKANSLEGEELMAVLIKGKKSGNAVLKAERMLIYNDRLIEKKFKGKDLNIRVTK